MANYSTEQADRATSEMIGLALAVLGAVATTFSTIDMFGIAGAFFWGGGVFILVTFVLGGRQIARALIQRNQWVRYFFGRDRLALFSLIFGVLFLFFGFCFKIFDWGEARWWRPDFTKRHRRLNVDITKYATSYFRESESVDLTTQQNRERNRMKKWLYWMAEGAAVEFPPLNKKPQMRLVYIASKPFNGNYNSFNVTLHLAPEVEVNYPIAFLVSGLDIEPWWSGVWRQINVKTNKNKRSVTAILSYPNQGERLVFLLRILPGKDENEYPPADQLVPSREFEVHL